MHLIVDKKEKETAISVRKTPDLPPSRHGDVTGWLRQPPAAPLLHALVPPVFPAPFSACVSAARAQPAWPPAGRCKGAPARPMGDVTVGGLTRSSGVLPGPRAILWTAGNVFSRSRPTGLAPRTPRHGAVGLRCWIIPERRTEDLSAEPPTPIHSLLSACGRRVHTSPSKRLQRMRGVLRPCQQGLLHLNPPLLSACARRVRMSPSKRLQRKGQRKAFPSPAAPAAEGTS